VGAAGAVAEAGGLIDVNKLVGPVGSAAIGGAGLKPKGELIGDSAVTGEALEMDSAEFLP
jgi:hypothetical protein